MLLYPVTKVLRQWKKHNGYDRILEAGKRKSLLISVDNRNLPFHRRPQRVSTGGTREAIV
jgi:hypothetical protein